MAEIKEFKGGNKKKDIDKEVFEILNKARPIEKGKENADRNPLAEFLEQSCMIVIPEKILEILLNKIGGNVKPETSPPLSPSYLMI